MTKSIYGTNRKRNKKIIAVYKTTFKIDPDNKNFAYPIKLFIFITCLFYLLHHLFYIYYCYLFLFFYAQ